MTGPTCTFGTPSEGTVREEVERRLAAELEVAPSEAHALLDLMETVLDEVLSLPEGEIGEAETARRLAERVGMSVREAQDFLDAVDRVTDEVDEEGLHPRSSDFLGRPESERA